MEADNHRGKEGGGNSTERSKRALSHNNAIPIAPGHELPSLAPRSRGWLYLEPCRGRPDVRFAIPST